MGISNNKGVYAVLVTLLLVVFIVALPPVKAHDEGASDQLSTLR